MTKHCVYFSGYNSTRGHNNPKIALLIKEGYIVTKISVDEASDIGHTIKRITQLKPEVLVGTSMGGFWATYYSMLTDIPYMVFNPVVFPSRVMKKHNETESTQKFYRSIEHMAAPHGGLLVLASKDPILDPVEALQKYSNRCCTHVCDTDDHRLDDLKLYEVEVRMFLQNKDRLFDK